jgi:vacuolar-type H+-ATPase subunit I/STV1
MKTLFSFVTCSYLILFSNVVTGQDDEAVERMLILQLNRIQSVFQLAQNGMVGSRQFEPIPEQVDKFAELQLKREEIQKAIAQVGKTEDRTERMAKWQAILDSMKSLEAELKEDILLPHQIDMLKQKEFSLLLTQLNGDFEKVIETYYDEQFGLTKKQAEQLAVLRDEISAEKRKLSEEYQKKLQKLEAKQKEKLSSVFSPRKKEIIEGLSGKMFAAASGGDNKND